MSEVLAVLSRSTELHVIQRKELVELLGFESRNKYSIQLDGSELLFAAEQGKGGLAFLARMFLGHFRRFEIHFFDAARRMVMRAVHPFRWFFQRLEVELGDGRVLGAVQQRFALLSKRFDVEDAQGNVLLRVSSPIWRPWTFVFLRNEAEVARVEKKWSGLLGEAFTDADRFRVLFSAYDLRPDERALVLAAALFIDLQYFERKA
ncbi:MAG TPA: phospholipid scramblase-related protein [Polyangiaceae bacterium]|nr:phospholipid scramblase-related protein [Polyangiaceae bacterium]